MKRIIALLLVTLLMTFALVGCGDIDRLNYVKGLKDKVELCDIDNITIDRDSSDFLEVAKSLMSQDLGNYTQKISEGTVSNGDAANIDYAGKVDGVAFTGGTAKGYDLTIGSGQFIEGFEDQLIGVKIGDTVDIKVTFPANYGDSTDLETGSKTITLSGAKAVFTVKVNYVSRPYSEINDDFASAAGYSTADEYMKELEDRSIKQYVINYLRNNSKVIELPADKEGNCYTYHKNYYTQVADSYYGMTFADFLASNGIDESTFKNDMLLDELVMYACFDKLGLEIPKDAVTKKTEELATLNNASNEQIVEYFTTNYIECIYVKDAVVDALLKKVTITGKSLVSESLTKE